MIAKSASRSGPASELAAAKEQRQVSEGPAFRRGPDHAQVSPESDVGFQLVSPSQSLPEPARPSSTRSTLVCNDRARMNAAARKTRIEQCCEAKPHHLAGSDGVHWRAPPWLCAQFASAL